MKFGLVTEVVFKSEAKPDKVEQSITQFTMLYNLVMDRIEYIPGQPYLFEGSVGNKKFRLRYLEHRTGKRTIRPIINGIIDDHIEGSMIRLIVSPSWTVAFPLIVPLLFTGIFVAWAVTQPNWLPIAAIILTPLVSYLVVKAVLASKASMVEWELKKIINGRAV